MNSELILFHLEEAKEELERIINGFKSKSSVDEIRLSVNMEHLYHHINTAWNSRNTSEDDIDTKETFHEQRKFPSDILM